MTPKRRKHRSSRRFPDQRRDLGDERACNHLPYITPDPVKQADEQFDSDRTLVPWMLLVSGLTFAGIKLRLVMGHEFRPAALHIRGGPGEADRLSARIGPQA